MATANEAKIFDARDNVLETLEFALRNGSPALQRRMRRKAAMFAAVLVRAQKVYEDQQQKFMQYLETLPPLVDGLPDDILNSLPPYTRRFAKALQLRDFDEAFSAWQKQGAQRFKTQLIRHLAHLYDLWLWRLTKPLRFAFRKDSHEDEL